MKKKALRRADTKPGKQLRLLHMKEKLADLSKALTATANVREMNSRALNNKLCNKAM